VPVKSFCKISYFLLGIHPPSHPWIRPWGRAVEVSFKNLGFLGLKKPLKNLQKSNVGFLVFIFYQVI